MRQPTIPALRTFRTTLANPICVKQFHSHCCIVDNRHSRGTTTTTAVEAVELYQIIILLQTTNSSMCIQVLMPGTSYDTVQPVVQHQFLVLISTKRLNVYRHLLSKYEPIAYQYVCYLHVLLCSLGRKWPSLMPPQSLYHAPPLRSMGSELARGPPIPPSPVLVPQPFLLHGDFIPIPRTCRSAMVVYCLSTFFLWNYFFVYNQNNGSCRRTTAVVNY